MCIERRRGFSLWPYVAFLVFFSALLTAVSKWYLIPAMDAFEHAGKMQQRLLATHALLIMVVLLLILALGLLLTYRLGRYFSRRPTGKPTATKYVDAWSESAKRMQTPPKEQE